MEVAGPLDVEDGVRAIDFLTDRIGAEPTKLGFLGDSYGSGISQLVAALDERERVHAVAALSTWGDVGEAFYENSTRHTAAVATLLSAAGDARLSERTRRAFDDLLADRNIDKTLEWAAERSRSPTSTPSTTAGCRCSSRTPGTRRSSRPTRPCGCSRS